MVEVKDGEYYYAPHRRSWGVWKAGKRDPKSGVRFDDFIMDFSTKIQARNFVYTANGWNKRT
jgi:hypothetical protein